LGRHRTQQLLPYEAGPRIEAVACLLLFGAFAACTRQTRSVATAPSRAMWPSYSALNVATRHDPRLTPVDRQTIEHVLAQIRPCERHFIRYAYTNPEEGPPRLVVFVMPEKTDGVTPHVIGPTNLFYRPPEGWTFILPPDIPPTTIAMDIAAADPHRCGVSYGSADHRRVGGSSVQKSPSPGR
jgi:hypothetical protein